MRPRSHRLRLLSAATFTAVALLGTSALQARADDPTPAPAPGHSSRPWLAADDVAHQRAVQEALTAAAAQQRAQFLAAAQTRASRSAPAPAPAPPAPRRTAGGWHDLIDRYSWDRSVGYRVMLCESHGNPSNGVHHGLFQIAGGPMDPATNVAAAFRMYQQRGWQPWAASRVCWR